MTLTTPKNLSGLVRNFCRQLSPAVPIFLPYTPLGRQRVRACHLNVDMQVAHAGGKPIFGWVIWQDRDLRQGVMFDAEFHCVWESPTGEILDLTPRSDGEPQILFLPDFGRSFDWDKMEAYPNEVWMPRANIRGKSVSGMVFPVEIGPQRIKIQDAESEAWATKRKRRQGGTSASPSLP